MGCRGVKMPRSKKFDLNRIATATGLTEIQISRKRIATETLKEIYDDYLSNKSMLLETQQEIIDELNKKVMPYCHSIRSRLKDPDHLIAKLIRNAEKKGGKYLTIDQENYLSRVNDLIGVRIVVLRQKDSKAVHDAILSLYENNTEKYVSSECDYDENIKKFDGAYIAEEPVVYITAESDRKFYENAKGLRIADSKKEYRSTHYIVRKGDVFFEIQVRTLFEEGWLEFDHAIKYPNDNDNPKKADFLRILNGLAHASDELISFYDTLEPFMNKKKSTGNDTQDNTSNSNEVTNQSDGKKLNDKILEHF